jgi:site-specific recombinase XerD
MSEDLQPISSKTNAVVSPVAFFNSVPEEILWQSNFNSKNTQDTYNDAIGEFMSFLKIRKSQDLREIRQASVIAFKNHLIVKGAKPSTVNNRLSALSSLFAHLADKRITEVNPVTGVRRLKSEYSQVKSKCLTRIEARRLLDAPTTGATDPNDKKALQRLRDRAIMHVFFFAGCRISELCNLKVKDFFEEKGFFILDFKLKGGKRNRVPINLEAKAAIEDYLAAAGHGDDAEMPLFLAARGNQWGAAGTKNITRSAVGDVWKKYNKQAGITGASPHSARTTFVSEALENDCPIEKVQKTVGHAQIKTTQMYSKRDMAFRESASFAVRY